MLQLENLPALQINKEKKVKDYRGLEPVKTLIWLVDDNLKFVDDFIKYLMLPSQLLDFVLNDIGWQEQSLEKLQTTRQKLLQVLNNDAKDLLFFRENHLTFAFQKNITKNQKRKPYVWWFKFAEKTRNEKNTEQDFNSYTKDAVFVEMIRKLSSTSLDEEDYSYIRYYQEFEGLKDVWTEKRRNHIRCPK